MTVAKESERRWLVKFFPEWKEFAELFYYLTDIEYIWQTYLKKDKDNVSPRVRKSINGFILNNPEISYTYNKKHNIEKGVNKEEECEITEKEYKDYLKDKDSNEVIKIRFKFKYKNQNFELDVFKAPENLCMLELELKDIDDKVELPKFISIEKNVTGSKEYNNYAISQKNK